jgi:RNA polymerase sigma-70 factor (ECF subfamily)
VKPPLPSGHVTIDRPLRARSRGLSPPTRNERETRFRLIYEQNFARLAGYTLRRSGGPEDAADAVADTFLVTWRRLDDVPDGDDARLWLYGVARRVLANQRRAEHRRTALHEALAREFSEISPEPAMLDLGPLRRAWNHLREQDRDLLGLATWEELSNEQIARVLGCSRAVAKLRLHRARRRLAALLAAEEAVMKPAGATGHATTGRASARPGTEEQ